jgi:hypothetical protein
MCLSRKRVYRMILAFWACTVTLSSSDTSSDSLAQPPMCVRTIRIRVCQPAFLFTLYSYGDTFATGFRRSPAPMLLSSYFCFIFTSLSVALCIAVTAFAGLRNTVVIDGRIYTECVSRWARTNVQHGIRPPGRSRHWVSLHVPGLQSFLPMKDSFHVLYRSLPSTENSKEEICRRDSEAFARSITTRRKKVAEELTNR